MIYTICTTALFIVLLAAEVVFYKSIKKLYGKLDRQETMIIKNAELTAELADRMDGVEDYVKIIRSETENDKHSDYWASVMNYNPYLQKEGEK